MNNMDKTTKNNPVAFQKVINGQNKVTINIFKAELLNLISK